MNILKQKFFAPVGWKSGSVFHHFSAFVLVLSVSLLSACNAPKQDPTRPQAWLKPGTLVTLPAPSVTPAINKQQLLTASLKGKTQSLMVLLNADSQKVMLAGLSPLGIRLFRLTYDRTGVKTEQSITLPEMPPASQVLADIMLSYWPVSEWQQQLPKGWTLKDIGAKRELRDDTHALIETITYVTRDGSRQPVSIQHHRFGYLIAIQNLDNQS
ncbi:DUF3261 domain-containing protein [Enterobacteriaceae bacterium H11S18]|uniref:DUF3261 domain-containing protein n=1 Tax=Dryocola clanedunensis TaxID=2925396 RepID=UPI0022EFDEFB|nr:DUF3261 domain-containing protein [Dryocola clanedunensis]MCT4706067.1 DUF3261 domain-containing protein [Dryocola clanedunensis]MCT4712814.1 DUF3261 domain-containing protein [Dryocola clanedunensis]